MRQRNLPTRAFEQFHTDFCEHSGCKYLIAVDGYSSYPSAVNCDKLTPTSALISGLPKIFDSEMTHKVHDAL